MKITFESLVGENKKAWEAILNPMFKLMYVNTNLNQIVLL